MSLFPFGFGMRVGIGLVEGEVGGELNVDMMGYSSLHEKRRLYATVAVD